MTAEQIVAAFDPATARATLRKAADTVIVRLAYGEFAADPLDGVPDALGSAAYDEMERRDRRAARAA